MSKRHIVRQGESLISLGKRYGVPAEKILDHPENRELLQGKRRVSVLRPGDSVTIPDVETQEVDASTNTRHRFRCHNRTTWLRLKFFREDEPRANEPYRIIVNLNSIAGQLDDQGRLEERIPADVQQVTLLLGENEEEEVVLNVGHMDPIGEMSGIQKRLNNLGFSCGNEEGEIGPNTREALSAFQAKHNLEQTGEIDDATTQKLEEEYGH